ncbi:MAG TPA: LptF/LptG family permease, partial [Flavilitoribacter sp.]|nr:LptF/LptG family permease [Flavilitoribacter sp.]
IIRKGGFGFPILVSIVFFMLFVVLTIFCRKIAETFAVPAAVAAWIPGGILFPIGMYVTYKAMRDAKALNFERLKNVFSYIGSVFSRLIPSK